MFWCTLWRTCPLWSALLFKRCSVTYDALTRLSDAFAAAEATMHDMV